MLPLIMWHIAVALSVFASVRVPPCPKIHVSSITLPHIDGFKNNLVEMKDENHQKGHVCNTCLSTSMDKVTLRGQLSNLAIKRLKNSCLSHNFAIY